MKKGKDPNTDAGASHMPRVMSDWEERRGNNSST